MQVSTIQEQIQSYKYLFFMVDFTALLLHKQQAPKVLAVVLQCIVF